MQLKKSRKQLQMMNPNYLKSSSTDKSKGFVDEFDDEGRLYNDLDDIPITELNLEVSLKVHCKF